MGKRYLIDTNIVIDFSENKLRTIARTFVASIIDSDPWFSVINKIELLGFSSVNDTVTELVEIAKVIELSDAIVNKTITIRKSHRIKLPDAIIAATALEHSLILITRNVADFQNLSGLTIINPWDM